MFDNLKTLLQATTEKEVPVEEEAAADEKSEKEAEESEKESEQEEEESEKEDKEGEWGLKRVREAA
jgi:hypothetical protein